LGQRTIIDAGASLAFQGEIRPMVTVTVTVKEQLGFATDINAQLRLVLQRARHWLGDIGLRRKSLNQCFDMVR
jgi:hypothetical protein